MKKRLLYFLAGLVLIARCGQAQDFMTFPTSIQHNGRTVVLYPDVTLLVIDERYTGNDNAVNALIEDNKMSSLFSNDSLKNTYTSNGRNQWLVRMNDSKFLPQDYASIQSNLPDGVYLAPAFRAPGRNSLEGAFVPLPNILIVDKEFANNKLLELVLKYATRDDVRSDAQVALEVFNIKIGLGNTYALRDRLVRRFPNLSAHVRFENQPLLSERRGESQQASTAASHDSWNTDIINAQPTRFDRSTPVRVAILDFGCDLNHNGLRLEHGVNLKDPSKYGSIVDLHSHGTWMAGIVGAKINSGVNSVVPDIVMVPIARSSQTDVEVAAGISYCIRNKIDVINMSFGRDGSGKLVGAPAWDFANINSAIDRAHGEGIIMVASSGDNFTSASVDYPARHPYVIAVGASDRNDKRVAISNFGDTTFLGKVTGISVVAPGADIWTTTPNNNQTTTINGGTSAAVAHVAGFAAFLKAFRPTLTNVEIRDLIESTTDKIDSNHLAYTTMSDFNNGTRNVEMGYGRINILNAINKLEARARIDPLIDPNNTHNNGGNITPTPTPSRWWLWLIGLLILAIILYFIFKKK